jgi:hypothetical protein
VEHEGARCGRRPSARAVSLSAVNLLIQLCGVLVLGVLLGRYLPGESGRRTALGVSVLAVAVAGFSFWGGVWTTGKTFIEQSESYPSVHEANVAPGSLFPANVNFLTEAEEAIPRKASVVLICTHSQVGCSGEWISYQLAPRLFVPNISEAEYVLVYGNPPKTVAQVKHLRILREYPEGGVVRTNSA